MRIARLAALVLLPLFALRAARADPPPPARPPAGAAPAPAPAATGAPTEADFLAAIARARWQLSSGDSTGGQQTLDDALTLHGDQDYVRAKRADLEDLVKRLAFRAACPPPDPATLVKGTLKKWVPKTGDLEIRYAAGKPNDFVSMGGFETAFPSRFAGPYTVTVRGASYGYGPETVPHIYVGMENDPKTRKLRAWGIHPGVPAFAEGNRKTWLPARILQLDGEESKIAAERLSPAKVGDAWRFKVQVSRDKVLGWINDASVGFVAKPAGVFGYAAVKAVDWTEIIFEGQVEPSWIQGKIDAVVEGKRAAFEAKFDPKKRLPAWLYQPRDPSKTHEPAAAEADSDTVPAKFLLRVMNVRSLVKREEGEAALELVEALRASGAPEAMVLALSARVHLAMGETAKALAEAEKATAADPGSVDALLARGEVLVRLGREDDAVALWDAVAAQPSVSTELYVEGAKSMLQAGRLETAKRLAERAERLGRRSSELDALGRVLSQATNGPTWPKTYEYKTTNYLVQSDIDVEVCSKAATVLEDALQIYREQVKPLKPEQRRAYRVFLFSGKEGFVRYTEDVEMGGFPLTNVLGLYSKMLKQLLIWNVPNRAEMMKVIRHEGFHQYLDRLLPDPPVWFNEGMAVYYEGMERVGGELKIGRPSYGDLALLEREPLIPLREFLAMSPGHFYRGGRHSYAQAWLLVHMLKHGSAKHRELYKSLLTRLETTSGDDAMREVFPRESLAALDSDLAAWRLTLQKAK